jgi:hypothetical protein
MEMNFKPSPPVKAPVDQTTLPTDNHIMKKFTTLLALAGALAGPLTIPIVTAIPVLALSACTTTSLKANLTTYGEIKDKVAAARISWADWIISRRAAVGQMADRNEANAVLLALAAKENQVIAALGKWFEANAAYRDAQKASADTLPAPAEVLSAGNIYLTTVANLEK